ncbi:MBL fold metallo-hydrolase [Luteimonas aquatica]|uniref:MBL fold metallo-hydrolase n=1 Tax=Luteimonas aquatica TaxID=450364 RepID=UPI001F55FED9|nr:MBL fold metallo-hydrolase [Luteimonas aquatica]
MAESSPRRRGRLAAARRIARWALAVPALLLAIALGALLLGGSSSFGGSAEGARLARMQHSPQWHDGAFANPQGMWGDMGGALSRMFETTPHDVPEAPIVAVADPAQYARPPATGLRVTWFGHSSTLVEIDGVNVLTDPLWSERTSPLQWVGPRRWFAPPLPLRALPGIDAVVISHDHYDHLDEATIRALRDASRAVFVVPLGVGAHLARWGVPESRIVELDWWQRTRVGGIEVIATPARHASGRMVPQSDKTLWAGYALVGERHRVFYSGDTGLHEGLRAAGERFGPFDVAMVEAGQYDADWPDWHMGPEQAVTANAMVRGRALLPVHWGLVRLAHHGWTEPAERVLAAAACTGTPVLTPRPGQAFEPDTQAAQARWWPRVPWQDARARPVVATRNGDPAQRYPSSACAAST